MTIAQEHGSIIENSLETNMIFTTQVICEATSQQPDDDLFAPSRSRLPQQAQFHDTWYLHSISGFHGFGVYSDELERMYWRC